MLVMAVKTFLLLTILSLPFVFTQECPRGWDENAGRCYLFTAYPERTHEDAMGKCINFKASLVSVNDQQENSFLVQRILALSGASINSWYTSGNQMIWEGDGTDVLGRDYWLISSEATLKGDDKVVAYQRLGSDFKFKLVDPKFERPYICEIDKAEVLTMYHSPRDYSFGVRETMQKSQVEVAPRLTHNPRNTVIIGKPRQIFIECIATGNPKPNYRWYRGVIDGHVIKPDNPNNQEVTTKTFPDYTLTNGRMTITNTPNSGRDTGKYQCRVENKHGTLLGDPVSLSFGVLLEFPNVNPSAMEARADLGTQIQCPRITGHPGLRYQWSKDDVLSFVRPETNQHIFISANGKLYFSRLLKQDAGNYYCIVDLYSPGTAQGYLGSGMVVSRTSRPVKLVVLASDGGNQKPTIQDDFIAVYPKLPKVNENIQLECFAFGTTLEYSWRRYGYSGEVIVPLPAGHQLIDNNRILVISSVQLEDSGIYQCSVYSDASKSGHAKNRTVTIESPPIFTMPLKNQFVDIGTQITWRCMAKGNPYPTYFWYHDGVELTRNNAENIEVNRNVIVIKNLQPGLHNGVYQCAAHNTYGTLFSSSELRVLSFKPTFSKQHMPDKFIGASKSVVRIVCNPEAAPFPTFVWKKDGSEIASSQSVTGAQDRVSMRADGTLTVREVSRGDAGSYECTATNSVGESSISTTLEVLDATTLNTRPTSHHPMINTTATLSCSASHHPNLDMVYQWYFNDRIIRTDEELHFIEGSDSDPGLLSIRDIQFIHAGKYTCVAKTQADSTNASAIITVIGPPSESAGVYAVDASISSTNLKLRWTDSDPHGSTISAHLVEASTKYDDFLEWKNVPATRTDQQTQSQKVEYLVLNLNPATLYKFRVRAINTHGTSAPSHPSTAYTTEDAPPTKAPEQVGGGGGKVGVLTITWKALSEMEHHGAGIGYTVYWRLVRTKMDDYLWHKVHGQASKFVTLVGIVQSYLEFEVKVQAFNYLGAGPNSTTRIINAAPNLPTGTPLSPYGEGYNSTALRIYWVPVPDIVKEIQGKLLGYKINYWKMDTEIESQARQAILPGQAESGLLIGLDPDTFYKFNIQVYNLGGNGPKSETYEQTTFNLPPQLYPTEVFVSSIKGEPGSANVRWRGVSTNTGEEPLQGYIVRYWIHGTDIRNATDIRLGRVNTAKVMGIKKNFRYQLRVLGYSRGGYGKMSMPALTFILVNSQVIIDTSISEIVSSAAQPTVSMVLLLFVYLFSRISS